MKITQNKYVFIGEKIYEFTSQEEIITFLSPIGGSDVPFPFAISEKNVFFFIEKCFVPIQLNADSYYYDENLKRFSRKLRNYKLIHKRNEFDD